MPLEKARPYAAARPLCAVVLNRHVVAAAGLRRPSGPRILERIDIHAGVD